MTRPARPLALAAVALAAFALALAPQADAAKKARRAPAPAQPRFLDPLTPTPPPPPLPITDADWRTPDLDNLLVVDTNKGRIIAELYPEAAPDTVARIKTLARQHFYDGLSFFRVIDGFMDQTGDPKDNGEGGSSLPDVKGEFTFRRAKADPFVQVAAPAGEVVGLMGALPVVGQPDVVMAMTNDSRAGAWVQFCPGVLGFARSGSPDSGNSQFFFMRAAYPALEKRYAGFGRVIVGQPVVDAIKAGEPVPQPQDVMTRVRLGSDMSPADLPTVRVLDPDKAAFKVLLARARDERGADFSVCDLELPSKVG